MNSVITKKIGSKHIVWFEKSNYWVQFEEPAWFVKKMLLSRTDRQSIAIKFSKKYNVDEQKSYDFISCIDKIVPDISSPTQNSSQVLESSEDYARYSFLPYSTRYYKIFNSNFAISYDSRIAEYYLHPFIAHLEKEMVDKVDSVFEIFSYNSHNILRVKGCQGTEFVFSDFMQLKKRLLITLVNKIYNKNNDDWMTLVHASAVTDGTQTFLFSSTSGSGKSTMAALLQAKGLRVIADDFVPIDAKTKRPFSFPAAIAVREGAFPILGNLYANLENASFNRYEYAHSSVRYIPTESKLFSNGVSPEVRKIIFIRYNSTVHCNFQQIDTGNALKLFHEQAWVSAKASNARAFINWFVKLKCYKLEYGNTSQGINTILRLYN
jgi:hypothetical protein